MLINVNNITEFNNYLGDYTKYLQKMEYSKDFQASDLQKIREFFEEHKSFIGESDVDGTVFFLKLVKQLKDLTKGTDEGSKGEGLLTIARKTAALSFNHLSQQRMEDSCTTIRKLNEFDHGLYLETFANWVNHQKIPIKKLGLSEDEMLELVPRLTYLDLTDGEYVRFGRLEDCTFTEEFVGKLLEKSQKLNYLLIRKCNIDGTALSRLKNSDKIKYLEINTCPNFNQKLPDLMPKLEKLIIRECPFNQKLPDQLPNLVELRITGSVFGQCPFNQKLPDQLPKLVKLILRCLAFNLFDHPLSTSLVLIRLNPNYFKKKWKELPNDAKVQKAKELLESESDIESLAKVSPRLLALLLSAFVRREETIKDIEKLLISNESLEPVIKLALLPLLTPESIHETVKEIAQKERDECLKQPIDFEQFSGPTKDVLTQIKEKNLDHATSETLENIGPTIREFLRGIPFKTLAVYAGDNSEVAKGYLKVMEELELAVVVPMLTHEVLIDFMDKQSIPKKLELSSHSTFLQKEQFLKKDIFKSEEIEKW